MPVKNVQKGILRMEAVANNAKMLPIVSPANKTTYQSALNVIMDIT